MFSAISSTAGAVFSFVSHLIPESVSNTAASVSDVAIDVFNNLTAPKEGLAIPARPQKSFAFFRDFKSRAETPYESSQLLKQLVAGPRVSKACLIPDYLTLLPPSKITHKIYDKLKSKWGYRQFHRIKDTGARGLASAFIMFVLLEDSPKNPSLIHDKLVNFLTMTLTSKKYPDLNETLKPMLDALMAGHAFLHGITSSDPCIFLDTLSETLVRNFYEKVGYTEELTFTHYVANLSDASKKSSLEATLALLGDCPSSMLVPLLGPKQSFFGHNPLSKFNFIISNLQPVLEKVKTHLRVHVDNASTLEWLEALPALDLLVAFDLDPVGKTKKDQLKAVMIDDFKEELIKLLTPNASLFLEGFSFHKKAAFATHFKSLADEIASMSGAYLLRLKSIPGEKLLELAQALESFEEDMMQRQLRFVQHMSDQFNLSFVIHSWQMSQQDTKRLKIQHIGKWFGPACHLVIFPENNTSRIDLLKQHSQYASRIDLIDIIASSSFKKFKRHGSETLSAIAETSTSASDRLLAKHFLYYRLHIFACLQKLLYQKLPLLKDPLHYDMAGSKEDDATNYNPFGQDFADLLPDFHSEVERNMFRLEKHLTGINREIAELAYITDCVFSHTKHEDIITEIQMLLRAAKKTTFQFYLTKIPDFISGFTSIVTNLNSQAREQFEEIKTLQALYSAANASKAELFRSLMSRSGPFDLTRDEMIQLVPRLIVDHALPPVFSEITKLIKGIETYQEAQDIDQAALILELEGLCASIRAEKERFTAFYPASMDLFNAIFLTEDVQSISPETVETLIPKDKLQHPDIIKVVLMLQQTHQKLSKLKMKKATLSADNVAALNTLKAQIMAKRASFIEINPTKTELFDRLMAKPQAFQIPRGDLIGLKRVPKTPEDDLEIYKKIKNLLSLITKYKSYSKEKEKLEEKYALVTARGGAAAREVDFYDSDDDAFPEAGSLGSIEGETASLGGASYSSELRSIGSVEKWISSLL